MAVGRRRRVGRVVVACAAVVAGLAGVLARGSTVAPSSHEVVLSSSPLALAADPRAGRLYAANGDGGVSALGLAQGAPLGTLALGAVPPSAMLDPRAGRLYIARFSNGLWSMSTLRSSDASPVRTVRLPATPYAMAIDALAARVLVATVDDSDRERLTVLDASSGSILVATSIGTNPNPMAMPDTLVTDPGRGLAYAIVGDGVVVLDTRRGAVVRAAYPGLMPYALALDARRRRLVVAGTDDRVRVLDLGAGRVVRSIGARLNGDPFVDDATGRIVAAGPNAVDVYDETTGARLSSTRLGPNPSAAALDRDAGTAYITTQGRDNGTATGQGAVWALDIRARPPLNARLVATAVNPTLVAVLGTGRTARLAVAAAGGAVQTQDPWAWLPAWLRPRLGFIPPPPGPHSAAPSLTMVDLGGR